MIGRTLILVLGAACILAGCGDSSTGGASEADLRKKLGNGPPSLANMSKHPGAANKKAANPGGGDPGAAAPTTG